MIVGELKDGKVTSISRELVTTGKKLANAIDQGLDLLLVGEDLKKAAEEAAQFGVDRVLKAEGPKYSEFHPERLASIISEASRKMEPCIILLGQTDMGRDTAPRIAAKLGAGVCLDCVDLSYDKGRKVLIRTKPVYGGFAQAQWVSTLDIAHIVTMRPRSAEPAEHDPSHRGEIVPLSIEFNETRAQSQMLETTYREDKGIKLEDAGAIVAGGGGIGGSEGFGLIQELADHLGAAVGTTRVPSEENWMPKSLEIGQTGHIVSPNLYVAVGISGAPQHMAGCASSNTIVAINKDPHAPIFGMADFGIVGDYREILPVLIARLKAMKE